MRSCHTYITRGQFHRKYSLLLSLVWVWKWQIWYPRHICQWISLFTSVVADWYCTRTCFPHVWWRSHLLTDEPTVNWLMWDPKNWLMAMMTTHALPPPPPTHTLRSFYGSNVCYAGWYVWNGRPPEGLADPDKLPGMLQGAGLGHSVARCSLYKRAHINALFKTSKSSPGAGWPQYLRQHGSGQHVHMPASEELQGVELTCLRGDNNFLIKKQGTFIWGPPHVNILGKDQKIDITTVFQIYELRVRGAMIQTYVNDAQLYNKSQDV